MNTLSIITPTFNSAKTLEENFSSILEQGVALQHILVDGGSEDSTVPLIQEYQNTSRPGLAVEWSSEKDEGLYDAMNKGIAKATGDVVGILNGDDRYAYSEVLKDVLAVFEDPKVHCCYGDLVYIDRGGATDRMVRRWKAGAFNSHKMYRGWMPPHPTFFVRRSLYDHCGLFRLDLSSAADYEFMLRAILKFGVSPAYLPKVLVEMGTGGVSGASIANRLRAHAMDKRAWKVNGLKPNWWTVPMKPLRKLTQWMCK